MLNALGNYELDAGCPRRRRREESSPIVASAAAPGAGTGTLLPYDQALDQSSSQYSPLWGSVKPMVEEPSMAPR